MIEFALLFANPVGTQQLDLSAEVQTIRGKLRAEQRKSFLKLHLVRDASSSAIEDALKLRPHLVHFSGHGEPSSLGVEHPNRGVHWMPKDALRRWIEVLSQRTRIVMLNSCHSIEDAEPFLSAVECVIGMRAPIGDSAAIGFASGFYSALGDGKSVEDAFQCGIAALTAFSPSEQDVPVLLTRAGVCAKDIRLFRPLRALSIGSDSSADRELESELQKTLVPLSRLGVLEYRSLGAVPVGSTRTQFMEDQLQRADVLLPLLSRDLINDVDLLESVEESMRRRKQLLVAPVKLRACDTSATSIAGLQVIPRVGIVDGSRSERDAAWESIAQELGTVISRLLTEWNERDHAAQLAKAPASPQMPVGRQAPSPTATSPVVSPSLGTIPAVAAPTAMPGKKPTRASLRALTSQLCPTIAQLDLFCTDYFPRLAQECSSGMSFTERMNLMLQRYDQVEIWQKLSNLPDFARHASLVVWE